MGQVLLILIHHSMTNEGEREKNIWHYITSNESSDIIGKITLEGHFKKKGTIGRITLESFSNLLDIFGNKEKCIKSSEFIYSKRAILAFPYQCKIHFHSIQ
jgi:hypothetical protein